MSTDHEIFMQLALEEASKAKKEGNQPIGSVIVRDGQLLVRGHNLTNTSKDSTAHSETVTIRNACQTLGVVDLSACTLYTTLGPCPMCCGAMIVAGISTLVMGTRIKPSRSAYGDYSVERLLELTQRQGRLEVITGILQDRCEKILEEWGR